MDKQRAVIIGGGPAGLTAAYELLKRTGIVPLVLEQNECLGGISRTVNYKGNRIDIGGHRFFSKSDRVMEWWRQMLPVQAAGAGTALLRYQQKARTLDLPDAGPDPEKEDRVLLLRPRKSRIYYLRKFFDYPVRLSAQTVRNLGLWRMTKIGASYLWRAAFPIREEKTLEQFFINRFGRELYETFFKSYTEKVWGIPCSQISAEWGAQRIKGLSIWATLVHASRQLVNQAGGGVAQKETETSLIEQFLYPKFGPGQMWEETARRVRELGGEIRTGWRADKLALDGNRVAALEAVETSTGRRERLAGQYFFSSAPVKELVQSMEPAAPENVRAVAEGLVYRDFVTVGLLVSGLKIHDETPQGRKLISDNWIYIQEPDVRLGRLQIFNNWSPFMVADPNTVWLGLEYFCNTSGDLWSMSDEAMTELAREELARIGIIDAASVLDSTVLRVEKTYPAYFGTYDRFQEIRDFVDRIENLFLVGRNGMHRYNNQDHSMLTAMTAVDNIAAGIKDKHNLWAVNTEMEYHEEKQN